MERPTNPERPIQKNGEYYLELLGLEGVADKEIPGHGILMRDFLDICGPEALPPLVGLDSIERDDPRFEPMKTVLRTHIKRYIGETE